MFHVEHPKSKNTTISGGEFLVGSWVFHVEHLFIDDDHVLSGHTNSDDLTLGQASLWRVRDRHGQWGVAGLELQLQRFAKVDPIGDGCHELVGGGVEADRFRSNADGQVAATIGEWG